MERREAPRHGSRRGALPARSADDGARQRPAQGPLPGPPRRTQPRVWPAEARAGARRDRPGAREARRDLRGDRDREGRTRSTSCGPAPARSSAKASSWPASIWPMSASSWGRFGSLRTRRGPADVGQVVAVGGGPAGDTVALQAGADEPLAVAVSDDADLMSARCRPHAQNTVQIPESCFGVCDEAVPVPTPPPSPADRFLPTRDGSSARTGMRRWRRAAARCVRPAYWSRRRSGPTFASSPAHHILEKAKLALPRSRRRRCTTRGTRSACACITTTSTKHHRESASRAGGCLRDVRVGG